LNESRRNKILIKCGFCGAEFAEKKRGKPINHCPQCGESIDRIRSDHIHAIPINTAKDRIENYLRRSGKDHKPREIAVKLGISERTTRSALSTLKKEDKLTNPRRGYWRSKPRYGVGGRGEVGAPPRVQNLQFFGTYPVSRELDPYVLDFPGMRGSRFTEFRLTMRWYKNGTFETYVKAPLGVDLYGFRLCVEHVKLVNKLYGIKINVDDLEVRRVEFLNDFGGVQLEGVSCVTIRDLSGALEKIYNKEYGAVRREARPAGSMPVDQFIALYQGGLSSAQVMNSMLTIANEVRALMNDQRDQRKILEALIQSNQTVNKALSKLLER